MDRKQPLAAATSGESSLDLIDKEMTPATAATWRELERRFQTACEQLEELDQKIVLMRHFEHLSNAEAASALELSPQAASIRYLRVMRRLREQMEGSGDSS